MSSYSPESLGVIQARLAYLQLRKAALDDLICSLERYLTYKIPEPPGRPKRPLGTAVALRIVGAA